MLTVIPSNTVPLVTLMASAIAVMAMATMAWVDIRSFEIDPIALVAVLLASAAAIYLAEGLEGLSTSFLVAVFTAGIAALALWMRPAAIGQGDIGLFGALGLIGGMAYLPLLLVLMLVFASMTSASYSLTRGKRLFRSMFPAALPAMAAAIPIFVTRIGAALLPDGAPAITSKFHIIELIGPWL